MTPGTASTEAPVSEASSSTRPCPGAERATWTYRYIELRSYVEQRHGAASTVVDNPGTGVEERYTAAADTLVTFEGNDASYRSHRPQSWEARVPADRIWHMVHASPDESTLRTAVSLSKQRNAGHVYITPDTIADGNPWDTLPPASYWNTQLSLAAAP
ncbi:spherulation-specific family 4 protein [Streptomyces globisporus]|uniref:spherulation-specific family 4 protein n=1 Tax=Streptomyces globisporus TaxID=1908 RepID=UPI0034602A01|nr:spherulation-specific family 4 protein [Streptomyces globisporus]